MKLQKYWDKFRFGVKRHIIEVLKSKNSDQALAAGYAIGTFISILPTPGFSVALGFAIVFIFKKINKSMVFIAMAIWNVWTVIPFFLVSKMIGDYLFEDSPVVRFELEFFNQVLQFSKRFLMGNLIVSIPFSIFSYYLAIWVIRKVRDNRLNRKANKEKSRKSRSHV